MFATKTGAARLSILSNLLVISVEVTAGILTGSISIVAGAVNSLLNLVASVVAFISVKLSDKPADSIHPFGHGKIENVGALIQAGIILVGGGAIIIEAVRRFMNGVILERTDFGIAAMLISITINALVSWKLKGVARATESIALEADARNLIADIWSSGAVLAGLVGVRLLNFEILDPVVAVGVALYIFKMAYDLLRQAVGGLIDERLPAKDEEIIRSSIIEHTCDLVGYHDLRTRKVGRVRHIDLHLVMAKDSNLQETHDMCDHLENDIKSKLPGSVVTIHVEPCRDECERCVVTCTIRDNNQKGLRQRKYTGPT